MAITEIALLRLLPPTTADAPTLCSKLAKAKAVMEKYTSRRFHYLQQVDDASLIYIIGEWDSLEQHMNGFIPSADNQALLEDLKSELTVDWLLHIDAPHATLPLPRENATAALVLSIGRHFIKDGERGKFEETFEGAKPYLQEYVTEGTIGGGWRVDKEEGKEEFVLLCPWKAVDQHNGFARTVDFKEYAKISDFVNDVEIKHAKMLEV